MPSPMLRTALPPVPLTESEADSMHESHPSEDTTPPPTVNDDEVMLDFSPPRTTPTSTPTTPKPRPANPSPPSEEEMLHAYLMVAETNRSIIKSTSANSMSAIPQFTPAPPGGFPHIHLAHAVQLFDFQAAKVITTWLKVPYPKVLIRVFDHDGVMIIPVLGVYDQ
ncbi:uncharacterized protein BJ212DRAFT_1476891 [Suillus subaureus]|uniref:Uncharacterized protein n=1 Tax=Suillus subaureus TaxID=48587 RepID=A0A9P7JH90_9AGAM|nr:uncharacterized protein BJ212DRAFT_1476891 [Suillus subaureus]KAG1822464.1 hypothetical protein BJ212DRAFT_1476891 [Suillus subaureus]